MRYLWCKTQAIIVLSAICLLIPAGAHADDLASLQGTWVSQDFPWTVEFRESTAVFRGGNPFHDNPANDDVYPEQSFRFTLDDKVSPRQLNINEEDFAKFRKMLRPYGSAEIQKHAKPFQGIYSIAPDKDEEKATEMQLEFYPQTRRWKTKKFNDRAFAYLEFVPTRKLRRISDAEAELYRRLSGVWQGELERDQQSLGPRQSFAIMPGWVVYSHGRMQLAFDDDQRGFTMKQTVYRESSPLAIQGGFVGSEIFGEGLFFPRSVVGVLGQRSRQVTTNWQGTFQFASDDVLAIEVSPFPKRILSRSTGKMSDFDTVAKSDAVAARIAALKPIAKEPGKEQEQKVLAEYQRIYKEGHSATVLTAKLIRMKQPRDEHPLSGLIRALHPDYPSQEFLEGTWRLKQQAQFDKKKSDPTKQYNHYEPVDITDAESWVFEPSRLTVKSASGARNDAYFPSVELKFGALRLQRQESDDQAAAYFQARIVDRELVLTGRFFDRKTETSESWKYTLERSESK